MSMNIPWGSPHATQFVTNVGLITSRGPHGDNVMAAEWTHHVSYEPGLIAVCIGHGKATLQNIEATKVFGVSLAASEQNWIASIAGSSHGNEVDKVTALRELGVSFTPAKKVDVLLVQGALTQFECHVLQLIPLGDHTMVVGEVVEMHEIAEGKQPLVYHGLKFWNLGSALEKPAADVIKKIDAAVEKYRKK